MARSDRPRLSTSDLAALKPDEYREAFLSFFSYHGRYTVREGVVVHHVESASPLCLMIAVMAFIVANKKT